ncbi:MAG: neprosin family prolyl endopeptidase [Hyphomicrobiales bacterium]|nr:neprosin family prolyl endopeptidase [Hyphomicrobiales bacterium]
MTRIAGTSRCSARMAHIAGGVAPPLAVAWIALLALDGGLSLVAAQSNERCPVDTSVDEGDPHPDIHRLKPLSTDDQCGPEIVVKDEERKRMEEYLRRYVAEETIITTLKLPSGEVIDCVDIYRQPALRRTGMEAHKIEFKPRGDPEDDKERESKVSEKDVDPASLRQLTAARQDYGADGIICPEKTIPIRHLTMEILLNFETLDDFFHKNPPHTANGPNNLHQYAHAYRNGDNWGAQSVLNVWSPYTERSSEFSLSQIWVVRGSGDNLETVETGWQKYRDLYGDYRPRLFIYFTPDAYGSGGCYNLSCSAFVQVNNSVYIGGGFTNISSHPHPSPAWEFKIRWQKDGTEGHWWLKYGDTWVGYYPRSLFDSNGLRNRASTVDFGGEIIDEQPGGRHTRTDMGSGHYPGDGFGYAAYQRQIRYITTNNVWGVRPSLTDTRSDSDCYDISVANSSGSWERYFYFGGGGYWAHCS